MNNNPKPWRIHLGKNHKFIEKKRKGIEFFDKLKEQNSKGVETNAEEV